MTIGLLILLSACSGDRHREQESGAMSPAIATAGVPSLAYSFRVGDELVYHTTDVARVLLFRSEHTETEAVCPLARRANGSWRLLVRWTFDIDGEILRDVCRIDIMPDGRLVDCNPPGYRPDLGPWRQIPADADRAERDGDVVRFRTESGSWAFDAARGRPAGVESETDEDGQTQKRTTTFREVVRRDAEWIRTAQRESEDVIDTLRRDAFRYRGARADRIDAAYAATKEALTSLLARTTLPELRGPVEDAASKLETVVRARREDAGRLRRHLDRPSPSWKLRDLEGKEHAVEDYRGSVLILDFWESG